MIPTYNKVKNEQYQFKFTVFTPVYNCEKTIDKVHQSLINQTYKNFEWLIINDGSTDNSHEIIEHLISVSPLNIQYVNNIENQHKMACFIEAISLAQGEFLLTFDGDDECMPNALEIFNIEYCSIPDHMKDQVCAVTGLCQDQFGNLVGDTYPSAPLYSNTFKSHYIEHVHGEKWGFTKTSVLKSISVNRQIFSKGLIPESIIWNLIAKQGYLTKYINNILRIYHIDVENSLSSLSVDKKALGSVIDSIASFNWFFKTYYFKTPIFFLKKIYVVLRASKYLPFNLKDYLNAVDSSLIKILILCLWPFRKLTV